MITEMTTSMVKCFKTCRKRYKYEYIDLLKPRVKPQALDIGTMYHAMLEQYAIKGDINIPLPDQVDEYNFVVAKAMANAYVEFITDKKIEFVEVELPFIVAIGYGKRLRGKIDAVIVRNGEVFLLEHKTTSQYGDNYLSSLLWEEQATNYLFAFNKLIEHGEVQGISQKALGMFYIIAEKPTIKPYKATPVEQRKYKKDGSLYANQREYDESLEDFEKRLQEWYRAEERVHINYVYRTPDELTSHVKDLNLMIKDMIYAEKEETFYRNPEACKILPCPYRDLCLTEDQEIREVLFVTKTKKNEEL